MTVMLTPLPDVKEWTNEDLKEFADLFHEAVYESSDQWQRTVQWEKAMEIYKRIEDRRKK